MAGNPYAAARYLKNLVMKREMEALDMDVPYIVVSLKALPLHERFVTGGWQVNLRSHRKEVFFVCLSERIVNTIGVCNLEAFHIDQKKPEFFIFHGMQGEAHKVEFVEFSLEVARLALKGDPYKTQEEDKSGDPYKTQEEDKSGDELEWLEKLVNEESAVQDQGGEKRTGKEQDLAEKKLKK